MGGVGLGGQGGCERKFKKKKFFLGGGSGGGGSVAEGVRWGGFGLVGRGSGWM